MKKECGIRGAPGTDSFACLIARQFYTGTSKAGKPRQSNCRTGQARPGGRVCTDQREDAPGPLSPLGPPLVEVSIRPTVRKLVS